MAIKDITLRLQWEKLANNRTVANHRGRELVLGCKQILDDAFLCESLNLEASYVPQLLTVHTQLQNYSYFFKQKDDWRFFQQGDKELRKLHSEPFTCTLVCEQWPVTTSAQV